MFVLAVLTVLSVQGVFSEECSFTRDCSSKAECVDIQDASCVCRFGSCITAGNPFFRDTQCNNYEDCECKETPETCFCRDGTCISDPEDKWECHNSTDCTGLGKCADKECSCSDNLCEYQCSTPEDCVKDENFCSTTEGYTCGCENSLCVLEKLPSECEELSDCVNLGKCEADKPCACTNNQCLDPWYFKAEWREKHPTKNCRDQTDCNYAIMNCQLDQCTCENIEEVTEYESWGECTPNVVETSTDQS